MHAETCPVCRGTGKTPQFNDFSTTHVPQPQACHGCNGAGWVVVPGDGPTQYYTTPWHGTIPPCEPFKVTWTAPPWNVDTTPRYEMSPQ